MNNFQQRFPVQMDQRSWICLYNYHSSKVKLLRGIITLTSVFNCLAYPITTSLHLLLILIIFIEKWLLKRTSFRIKRKPSTVTKLLSSILKNEILKASIDQILLRLFSRIFFKTIFFHLKFFTGCCHQNTIFLVRSRLC